ncbi:MAG: nucleotidyl transferase AbiEii/AbiGii toxin family protein [Candidatus Moranbacteria bacterium]|nr:nucleotidyl transferase AbiEii/AbiGii toxin family protein [Candidatus Moranbacteria bacterium]
MTLDISAHRSLLLQILKDIYTDTEISPHMGFKGGTAAYFFYGLSRFSVDLDFDLLDKEKEDLVFSKVEKIAQNYGEIKDASKKRHTLFFVISYEEKSQNIKLEINLRDYGSKYEIKTYLGIPMQVMNKEDMFANKFIAMLERKKEANRDIFDVWFFLKHNWPLNKTTIEERTGLGMKKFLEKCIQKLEKKTNRNILDGMGELLDEEQKKWAKENLLNDTIFLLKISKENETKS